MALAPATVWEVRTAGSANNGSGFNNRIPGTSVDYSQQNASQLSINDLVGSAANATVTSVAAGFTSAMVGNVMRIRGGANFTVGFYEIVQFNGANSVDLDRIPCTGAGSGGLAEVGGAQINLDLIDTVAIGGNTIFVKNGVYAAHPALTFNVAYPKTEPLRILGYDVARGDDPIGNNRPVLQMGANNISVLGVIQLKNIRFEGSNVRNITATSALSVLMVNCKITNTAAAGTVYLVSSSADVPLSLIDCELVGTAGATSYGVEKDANLVLLNCYLHDLSYGVLLYTGDVGGITFSYTLFNIFANITFSAFKATSGFTAGNESAISINNSYANIGTYAYETPVNGGNLYPMFINNTFSDCIIAGIRAKNGYSKNNNWFACGTPIVGAIFPLRACDNNMFVIPQYFTPGSNYALQRTSGLIDKAFSMRLGV